MKRIAALVCVAMLSVAAVAQFSRSSTLAQEGEAKKSTYRKRLPNYYGQIGISKTQREEIYSIQKSYHDQIETLRQQIADLESKRDSESRAVLTEERRRRSMILWPKRKHAENRERRKSNRKSSVPNSCRHVAGAGHHAAWITHGRVSRRNATEFHRAEHD